MAHNRIETTVVTPMDFTAVTGASDGNGHKRTTTESGIRISRSPTPSPSGALKRPAVEPSTAPRMSSESNLVWAEERLSISSGAVSETRPLLHERQPSLADDGDKVRKLQDDLKSALMEENTEAAIEAASVACAYGVESAPKSNTSSTMYASRWFEAIAE